MSNNNQTPLTIVSHWVVNRRIDPMALNPQLLNAIAGLVDGILEGERVDLRELKRHLPLIIKNTPHSCQSDEHCCALHAAHKTAAEEVENLIQALIDKIGKGNT